MLQPRALRRDQTPQRILVIRFSSIGDILLTTPVLRLLRLLRVLFDTRSGERLQRERASDLRLTQQKFSQDRSRT